MSKIIKVINVMISNSDKITKVLVGSALSTEFFFLYDQKHKWSLSRYPDKSYYLHYYPDPGPIELLANMDEEEWNKDINYITYSSKDIKTRESFESMNELYSLLKEKILGIDDVFDDIIKSDETF